ncbi:MAG: ABC transporter permease [Sedimentibacter sp.]|uniref:ABC transporter permease n=1 Tax=Sedimentibacter sp. TaxID=1960295 RepID=UPI0031594B29
MKLKRYAVLLLMPGTVMLLLFLFLPLLSILFPTFFKETVTFGNYIEFFRDSYNLGILWRTFKISIIVTIICVLAGVPTAYFMSLASKRTRSVLLAVTLFPLLTNSVVRSFAWITILGKNGVLNSLLMNMKVIKAPLSMLYTESAIIIGTVYLFLPILITTVLGVLDNIDNDLIEAAQTLGASYFKSFMKVILPLCVPGILVGSMLVFTGTLTAYTTPQLLGGNKNMMLSTMLYQEASALGNWESAGVIALVMIVLTLIVMKFFNFIARQADRRGEDENA